MARAISKPATPFEQAAFQISEGVFTVLWAIALAVLLAWSAHRAHRGLFNASMTFAGLHFYTQLFESFGTEPLAYVFAGLLAIPFAWFMWHKNQNWSAHAAPEQEEGE